MCEGSNTLSEKERKRAKQEGIMRIKYPKAIRESEEDLTSLEQRLRGQKAADRVRMLKSGTVQSLKDCAPLVGYSATQLTLWWENYLQRAWQRYSSIRSQSESLHD
jgi:hypothetical protein